MLANEKWEILLEPALTSVNVNDTRLISDLQALQRSVYNDAPLMLDLSVDVNQSVERLWSDLKIIQKQLNDELKISIGLDTSNVNDLANVAKKEVELAQAQNSTQNKEGFKLDFDNVFKQIDQIKQKWKTITGVNEFMKDVGRLKVLESYF